MTAARGLLGSAPGLEEGGVVAALAQLGNAQLNGAGPGLPGTIPVAIAAVQTLSRVLLVIAGTAQGVDLHFHQALGGELHHLAQHVDIGAFLGKLGQCDSCVGHRGLLFKDQGWYSHLNPIRNHGDHPTQRGRRRAASRFGLRPTRLAARLKTYTTSWDAARAAAARSRRPVGSVRPKGWPENGRPPKPASGRDATVVVAPGSRPVIRRPRSPRAASCRLIAEPDSATSRPSRPARRFRPGGATKVKFPAASPDGPLARPGQKLPLTSGCFAASDRQTVFADAARSIASPNGISATPGW